MKLIAILYDSSVRSLTFKMNFNARITQFSMHSASFGYLILWCICRNQQYFYSQFSKKRGWSGGAMVLSKLPKPGRPTILITVGQGPIALAVGAGRGWFGHFYSHLSFLFFLPLFGRRPHID